MEDLRKEFTGDRRSRLLDFKIPKNAYDLDALVEYAQLEQDSANLTQLHQFALEQIRRLSAMQTRPYFGRFNWREANCKTDEFLYVGLNSLMDDGGDVLVYDWRASISSIYYDFEPGPASYDSQFGCVTGDMVHKRQYTVQGGSLVSYFDTDVTVRDEMLKQVLGKVGPAMQSIVATIQREQNQAIRDLSKPTLVVEGPAGSGKTSVAMQRAAFLLYRHRDTLVASKMTIVTPNSIFSDYVSRVLPELGEENIGTLTLHSLVHGPYIKPCVLESMGQFMERILTTSTENEQSLALMSSEWKRSSSFLKFLHTYVEYVADVGFRFQDVSHRGQIIFSAGEAQEKFSKTPARQPLSGRLAVVREWAKRILADYRKECLNQTGNTLSYQSKLIKKNTDIRNETERIVARKLKRLERQVFRQEAFNPLTLYTRLFEEPTTFATCLARLNENTNGRELIRQHTLMNLAAGRVAYEDVGPLLWLSAMTQTDMRRLDIRHVIVDEGQDYSPVDYAALKHIFPGARFTITGDTHQAIKGVVPLLAETVKSAFGEKEMAALTLHTCYRSTVELVRFCQSILPGASEVRVLERHGEKPSLIRLSRVDENDVWKRSLELAEARVATGVHSVAVITRTAISAERLTGLCMKRISALLLTEESRTFQSGIVIVPAYLAKGLEFECVIVPDTDAYGLDWERALFYTVCSRAMNELWLVAQELLPFGDSSLTRTETMLRC